MQSLFRLWPEPRGERTEVEQEKEGGRPDGKRTGIEGRYRRLFNGHEERQHVHVEPVAGGLFVSE